MRMRVVGWNVQPVIMADDGENLVPVPVAPQMITAAQWEAFKAGGDADALAQIRAELEPPAEPDPSPGP